MERRDEIIPHYHFQQNDTGPQEHRAFAALLFSALVDKTPPIQRPAGMIE